MGNCAGPTSRPVWLLHSPLPHYCHPQDLLSLSKARTEGEAPFVVYDIMYFMLSYYDGGEYM